MVYVLDKNGKPLMPTEKHGKIRHLLNDNKAKVVKKMPFTVQLLYDTTSYTQPITLGVDAGSKHIGLSATTSEKELYAADILLRTDIVDKISTRKELRTSRRNRKTRYRKPRFNNRTSAKKKGWLAPSIVSKIDTHINSVNNVCEIIPISNIIVETAAFDTQLLKATEAGLPAPVGVEYQQGEQMGFWNTREYVLFRDGHTCKCCKCKPKPGDSEETKRLRKILNVHHIESRKTGGDAPNNLITLCEVCHKEYHAGKLTIDSKLIKFVRGTKFNDAAFMGIMRWAFYNRLKEMYPDMVHITYGYITKNTRIENNLPKEHFIDARCISGNPKVKPLNKYYSMVKLQRHIRSLHVTVPKKGGVRKSQKSPYEINGIQRNDVVLYAGQQFFVASRQTKGPLTLRTMTGVIVKKGDIWYNNKQVAANPNYKNVKVIRHSNGFKTTLLPFYA